MADEIRRWLEELSLGEYAEAFETNAIDNEVLKDLDDDDLKAIGVAALGHRKKLLKAIQDFRDRDVDTTGQPTRPAGAERRQLTVMFVDMVGSTALSGRLDPEEMREAITAYQNAVAGVVTRFDGHVAKYMGDGVLCYFGWPRAHEDDAERAIRAALDIMRAMAGIALPNSETPSARAGIATGLVVVGDLVGEGAAQEEAVIGETPNLAARLQGLAAPGQIVLSSATRALLGNLFELEDLGRQPLKGIEALVAAYALIGARAVESRFEARHSGELAAMFGREQELALLLERWRQAKTGEGQMVLLTGEAGIGKSRITRALIDAVEGEAHTRINYQCSPYHADSALYPVTQQLAFAAEFQSGDTAPAKLDKLEALLGQGTSEIDSAAPLIAALLGLEGTARYGALNMTPQQQRQRTLQALAQQLVGLAERRAVLFVVEDAHWIDPTTLELIDLALDRIAGARVLALVTARPTFEHGFGGHPIVTRLALNRLGRTHIMAIVDRLSGGKLLPEALLEEIAAKTDGVPLFVEELTKTVLESGQLRQTDDAYELDGALQGLAIPASLHDSLMARLDRLQPVKEVAQAAACIGREFDYSTLSTISPLAETELQAALGHLIEAELIFHRGLPPEATYTFKHALVRDAAYESLLRSTRQQVHARLVAALEAAEASQPEVLAHHATEAGFTEKALGYWQQAGEEALARPAYQEAVGHLSHAIRLTEAQGEDRHWREKELELQVLMGQVLIANQGYAADLTSMTFDRALALCEEIGETPFRVPALFGYWSCQYIRSESTEDMARDFAEAVAAHSESGPHVVSLRISALVEIHRGNFIEGMALVDQALDAYDPAEHRHLAHQYAHDPRAAALNYKSWLKWWLGYPEQSDKAGEAGLAWAQELDHANTIGIALCWGRVLPSVMQGRVAEAANWAIETIEISTELVMPLWRAWSRIYLGWAQAKQGHYEEGLSRIAAGFEEAEQTGAVRWQPMLLGLHAEAQSIAGQPEAAIETLRRAFDALARTGDLACEAELYRLRAEILSGAGSGDGDGVAVDFTQAITVARRQNAKSLELRAATGLARFWSTQDKRAEARDLLAPLYGWFTEGFDTPDLKDAKALLDELA